MNIEEAVYLLKYLTKSLKQDEKNQIYKEAIEILLTAYEKEKALAKNHKVAFEKQTENLHEVEALYEKEKEKNKNAIKYIKEISPLEVGRAPNGKMK